MNAFTNEKLHTQVHALSRTEASDAKLRALGAEPTRGDLTSLSTIRTESKEADAVINLATTYVFNQGKYEDTLPIDNAALDAMCDGVAGTNKPLITTTGTLPIPMATRQMRMLPLIPLLSTCAFEPSIMLRLPTAVAAAASRSSWV
ncbi:hypothetical protein P3342_003629 [Pyrenophora teres f. teres]|uniref:Uncharacterized protein n=1 Tax=Pyrenophora teres f. teres TaxID=97479 RepID=A0A6S6VTA4_9PLEO|nr:hypothetical protein HRS9139_02109 [Pyrenophora teres f. teres]KAE8850130.1 hypothetical protein PTNB85_00546 [Pyrenophora teres f. teres]KAE8870510.1 hypothetical protein PTNB29_00854 [Pyrenophora teres f. teres]KAE8874231.1 hypothetical protein PTNB73_00863 [Pyrenophora teres f. teres]KAK1915815.1 hypothetical protein P3342_003629 [Pyrenophora teres f. teres]